MIFRFFFPDAVTPLQRQQVLLTTVVFIVAGAMWVSVLWSGIFDHAPPLNMP